MFSNVIKIRKNQSEKLDCYPELKNLLEVARDRQLIASDLKAYEDFNGFILSINQNLDELNLKFLKLAFFDKDGNFTSDRNKAVFADI